MKSLCVLTLIALGSSSCSAILFVRDEKLLSEPANSTEGNPSFEKNVHFFFLGLAGGGKEVNLSRVCMGKPVDQVATTYTFENVLFTVLTLGIYAPRTVQVWCSLDMSS